MISLRKRFKALHQTTFANPLKCAFKSDNIRFHGVAIESPDWAPNSHSLAVELADGPLEPRFYIAMNAWSEPLQFELPKRAWFSLIDTAQITPHDVESLDTAPSISGSRITVQPDAIRILISTGCAK